MRQVSAARARENRLRRAAIDVVRVRDMHRCVGGQWINPETLEPYLPLNCNGPLNGHEIITRAQGGSITDQRNIVLLCDLHNEWCTAHHDEAVARGFRVSRTHPYSPVIPPGLPHLRGHS